MKKAGRRPGFFFGCHAGPRPGIDAISRSTLGEAVAALGPAAAGFLARTEAGRLAVARAAAFAMAATEAAARLGAGTVLAHRRCGRTLARLEAGDHFGLQALARVR